MFHIQLRNELLKLAARSRTYVGFCVFCFVEVAILTLLTLPQAKRAFGQLMINNGLTFEDGYTGLSIATTIIYLTVGLLGVLYLALISGDMVAKEVEDGTMRMILARPVSRVQVLTVKAIVCIIHTFVLIFFIGITSLIAALLYRHRLGNLVVFALAEKVFAVFSPLEGFWRYFRALVFLGLSFQTVSGLGLMFSCFPIKPATATILTLSTIFVDMVLRSLPFFRPYEHYFLTHHLACWVLTFQYVEPWTQIWESICYLTALTVSFWVIGGTYFCVRDFKP